MGIHNLIVQQGKWLSLDMELNTPQSSLATHISVNEPLLTHADDTGIHLRIIHIKKRLQ